jgi:hypothetical protein
MYVEFEIMTNRDGVKKNTIQEINVEKEMTLTKQQKIDTCYKRKMTSKVNYGNY